MKLLHSLQALHSSAFSINVEKRKKKKLNDYGAIAPSLPLLYTGYFGSLLGELTSAGSKKSLGKVSSSDKGNSVFTSILLSSL